MRMVAMSRVAGGGEASEGVLHTQLGSYESPSRMTPSLQEPRSIKKIAATKAAFMATTSIMLPPFKIEVMIEGGIRRKGDVAPSSRAPPKLSDVKTGNRQDQASRTDDDRTFTSIVPIKIR